MREWRESRGTGRGARARAACAALLLLFAAGASGADTIQVKGETLSGRVAELTPGGLLFEPDFGSGTITVSFDDLEDVQTETAFRVLHGDEGEVYGLLVGYDAGRILVGESPASAQAVEAAALFHAYRDDDADASTYEQLQSRFRYWSGSIDGGAALVQSTSDTLTGFLRFRAERRKDRFRFLVDGNTRYASEKQKGEPRNVTENIITGRLRGEYDVTKRLFGYASTRATYDEDQHLSLRSETTGGLGVRLIERDEMTLSTDVGVGWIYEDYFGKSTDPVTMLRTRRGNDNFWTVAFGLDFMRKLPIGAVFRASGDYLPAVDDWQDDYLARGEASLEFPLVEWLSFNLTAIDDYDNTPAEDSDRNKLSLTAGLSVRF